MNCITDIIDFENCPIDNTGYRERCKSQLDEYGVLVLSDFLLDAAILKIQTEGHQHQNLAYYTADQHNVYLLPKSLNFSAGHARNRLVNSSKGCITTDQIPKDSPLHTIYQDNEFKNFLCEVLGQDNLFEYADPLSSINLHYASEGQELGWHFDNSSFAITLLIQAPRGGGQFEYVKDVRDVEIDPMNFAQVTKVLDGKIGTSKVAMKAGTLVLFRGQNSMHRVTPVQGDTTRMLVVLAYNNQPGIALSESARMTFFGRLE